MSQAMLAVERVEVMGVGLPELALPAIGYVLLALILAVISAAFMIPVLMEFAQTGLVPRFPTLIACCVTMLAALLLSQLLRENKQLPEMFEYFGWCSWDAFYHKVNEAGLLEKMEEPMPEMPPRQASIRRNSGTKH